MRYLLWIMAVLLIGFSAPAVTNYVVTPGTPGVTPLTAYTNWSTAATSIIDVVAAATNNNSIFITNGTYILTNQIAVSSKILTIRSYHDGYTDWTNTIIDGNYPNNLPISNRCFDLQQTAAVLLDGFTIRNGNPGPGQNGGGVQMYTTGTAHTVRNCRITGNTAFYGGGIYSSRGLITNCFFVGNQSSNVSGSFNGAGLYVYGGEARNCVFSNNYANTGAGAGGGLMIRADTVMAILRDCTISSNYVGGYGGGIECWGKSESILITNCVIINNRAVTSGGGVDIMSGVDSHGDTNGPFNVMQDCTISNNSAGTSGGGVFFRFGTNITVRNCLITSNAPEVTCRRLLK